MAREVLPRRAMSHSPGTISRQTFIGLDSRRVGLNGPDDFEEVGTFPASGLDQLRAGNRRLHRTSARKVAPGHAAQIVCGDVEQASLETFSRLACEAGH